jgi:hypothetical protein
LAKTRPLAADFHNIEENIAMIPIRSIHVSLAATLVLLAGLGTVPVLADEPTVVVQENAESSLSQLLKDILADTNYNYERFHGVDDCSSPVVYNDSRALLGKYADAPAQYESALRNYILSDQTQCNCVRALIGKNFDILVDTVRSDMSQVPCPR